MHCQERIRELEEQLRELQDACDAEVKKWEERVRYLEEDCQELQESCDAWYDQAEEWKQSAHDYEYERDKARDERDEALERVRKLEEELDHVKPEYEALLTIFQEELEHLETHVMHADWEQAVQQLAHIRQRYHAAIALHALQNQNTK